MEKESFYFRNRIRLSQKFFIFFYRNLSEDSPRTFYVQAPETRNFSFLKCIKMRL